MKLIVGLGNPGQEYHGTRHNVGFAAVGVLAARLGWLGKADDFSTMARSRFDALVMDGVLDTTSGQEKLLLMQPMTFMNLSGKSVQQAMAFFQLKTSDVLVLLDDLALPCGKIRIRGEGSPGGHNGLKDIEKMLGSAKYARLRIGIDAVPPRIGQSDYVLQKFSPEQKVLIEPALIKSAACSVIWADQGLTAAMNQFNPKETATPDTTKPKETTAVKG